jgi:hypothetical protein
VSLRGVALALRVPRIDARQLHQPDRGLQVGHAEVVAQRLVDVAHAHPVLAQHAHPFGQRGVVGGDHAAFAGRHVLGRVKRVAGRAPRPQRLAVERGAVRLARVLDDRQAVLGGDLGKRRHVGRLAEEMHRDDRARARGDLPLDAGRVDGVVDRVDVGEARRGAGVENAVCRSDKAEGRRDHLVAGADAVRQQRHVQRRRAGADGHGIACANPRRKALLEFAHALALRQLPGTEHFQHRRFFFFTDKWFCNRNHLVSAPISTVRSQRVQ